MAIFYVDPVSGSDSNGGTTHDTDPWASFQHALDNVTSGNDIYLMNTGTETLTGTDIIKVDTNASSLTSQIHVYGADSNGDRLNGTGVYTIDGSMMSVSQDILQFVTITTYMTLHDIRITGSTRYGVFYASGTPFVNLVRCTVDTCTTRNVYSITTDGVQTAIDCDIYGCPVIGIGSSSGGTGNLHLYASKVHDNVNNGFQPGGDFSGFCLARHCQFYDNGGRGIITQSDAYLIAVGNTIYGNSSQAIRSVGTHLWAFSNSLASNGSNGIYFSTNPAIAVDYNHYNGNSSTEWSSDIGLPTTSPELNKQTGDPLFTSVTDGSEDFTPLMSSPLVNNALASGRDIGAIESASSGGMVWWQP